MEGRPLLGAHINLTEKCNLHCKYCFVEHNPATMNMSMLQAAIDWLLAHAAKQFHLTWFGGEPLLQPDLMFCGANYLTHRGNELGIHTSAGVVTNGTLLTPAIIERLYETGHNMLFSYDGRHTQPVMRGGDVVQLESSLRQCLDAGIRTTVAMQVSAGYTDRLLEDYMAIREIGAQRIALNPVVHCYNSFTDTDWAYAKAALLDIADYEFEHMMSGAECGYTQMANQLGGILQVARGSDIKVRRTDYTCGACKGSLAIDAAGNIMPCQQMTCAGIWERWKLGNVVTGEYDPEKRERFVTDGMRAWADCSECAVIRCAPCRTVNYAKSQNELERAPDMCRWQRTLFTAAIKLHNRLADSGYYDRPR
jgi:uncharacterized protein